MADFTLPGSPLQGANDLGSSNDTPFFTFEDTVKAVGRGGFGAIRSAYSLIDTLSVDLLPDWDEGALVGHSETTAGKVVEGISQFAAGWLITGGVAGVIGKGLGLGVKAAEGAAAAAKVTEVAGGAAGAAKAGSTLNSLGRAAAKGAVTDFTFFDGASGRLSDSLRGTFLENDVTRYLSSGADDSELEGRLKNALEGLALGSITDGVMLGFRKLKAYNLEKIRARNAGRELTEAEAQAAVASVPGDVPDELRKNIPELPGDFKPPTGELKKGVVDRGPAGDAARATVKKAKSVEEVLASNSRMLSSNDLDAAVASGDIPEHIAAPLRSAGITDIDKLIRSWRARESGNLRSAGQRVESYGGARDAKGVSARANAEAAGIDPDTLYADGGLNLLNADIGESQAALLRSIEFLNAADFAKRRVSEGEAAARSQELITELYNDAVTETPGQRSTFTERINSRNQRSSGDPVLDRLRELTDLDEQVAEQKGAVVRIAPDVINEMKRRLTGINLKTMSSEDLVDLGHMYERGVEVFARLQGLRSSTGRQLQAYDHSISRTIPLPDKLKSTTRAGKQSAEAASSKLSAEIKRLAGASDDGVARDKLVRALGQLDTMLNKATTLKDQIRVFNDLGNSSAVDGRPLGMTMEYFMGNLLSGFKTHIVNFLGNTTAAMFRPFESVSAGVVQTAGMLIGQSNWRQASESFMKAADETSAAIEMVWEMVSLRTNSEVVKGLKEVALNGSDSHLLGAGRGHEIGRIAGQQKHITGDSMARTMMGQTAQAMFGTVGDSAIRGVGEAAGRFARAPMRALQASDELFKQLNFRMTLKADLRREARRLGKDAGWIAEQTKLAYKNGQAQTRQVLWNDALTEASQRLGSDATTKELAAKAESLLDMSLDTANLDLVDRAVGKAEEYTFTTPVTGKGLFDTSVRKIGELRAAHPIMGIFFPFTQTPANLAKFSASRTALDPAAALVQYTANKISGKGWAGLEEASNTSLRILATGSDVEKAEVLGRWGMASGMTLGIFSLANNALENLDAVPGEEPHTLSLLGRGPSNPLEKKAWLAAGNQEYSFRWGDTSISLARLDPYATVLGLAADIAQFEYFSDDLEEGQSFSTAIASSLATNFVNKTYLSGLDNLMTVLQAQDTARVENIIEGFAGGFAPGGALVAQTNQSAFDGHLKEVRSTLDAVMSRYPLWSDKVENRRNLLGEEMVRIGWTEAGTWESKWSPFPRTDAELADPLMKEIAALKTPFRGMPSSMRVRGISVDLLAYTAPNGHTALDRARELSGTIEIGGMTMRERLMATVEDPRYQGLPLAGSDDALASNPRAKILNSVMSAYRASARNTILEEIPDILKDVEEKTGYDANKRPANLFE